MTERKRDIDFSLYFLLREVISNVSAIKTRKFSHGSDNVSFKQISAAAVFNIEFSLITLRFLQLFI